MTDLMNKPTRGRHRALTPQEEAAERAAERALVPADVRAALRREVEDTEGAFDEDAWSFAQSTLVGRVAHRRDARPSEWATVVISQDCRTAWVPAGADPLDALAALERDNPVPRSQIEFLLSEKNRFYRGAWHVVPVHDLGWVCTRSSKFGARRHFVVSRYRHVAPVETDAPDVVLARLSEVAAPQA